MMHDEERDATIEKATHVMERVAKDLTQDYLGADMLAAIILVSSMAKKQNFPIAVLHKMIDELCDGWDAAHTKAKH